MKFRVISDVHNEFYSGGHFDLAVIDDEKEMCLIMAGDIGLLAKPYTYESFVKEMCSRHKYVFWVEGNHEWYHGNVDAQSVKKVIENLNLKNLYTSTLDLEEEKIILIGKTLWTDFDDGDPMVLFDSNMRMNDYHLIRKGSEYSKFRAENAMALHFIQKRKIFEDVADFKKKDYTVIVVTHHHPSFKGVKEEYKGDSLNGAYCSDLSKLIIEHKPDYWICGHIHKAQVYSIGETMVYSNPVGYPGEYGVFFEKSFYFEVKKN